MANPKSYKSWLLSPMHKAHRQVSIYMENQMKDLGLSMSEGHLLSYVARYGPCAVGELLRVLGIPKSTLTSMLDRMVERRFVERELNPADRGSFLVAITPDGEQMVVVSGRLLEDFERDVAALVGHAAISGMSEVLQAINDVSHVDVRGTTVRAKPGLRRNT